MDDDDSDDDDDDDDDTDGDDGGKIACNKSMTDVPETLLQR